MKKILELQKVKGSKKQAGIAAPDLSTASLAYCQNDNG